MVSALKCESPESSHQRQEVEKTGDKRRDPTKVATERGGGAHTEAIIPSLCIVSTVLGQRPPL